MRMFIFILVLGFLVLQVSTAHADNWDTTLSLEASGAITSDQEASTLIGLDAATPETASDSND